MAFLFGRPESRIGRGASPFEYEFLPILSVVAGSLTPLLPVIAQTPLMPPFGFVMLLGWRLLRREMWPAWVGVPFGLVDDLFSGATMGSAVLLWTLALLALDMLDRRMIWRVFIQDWLIFGMLVAALLYLQAWIAMPGPEFSYVLLIPQLVVSILVFPVIFRTCSALDKFRNRR